MLIIICWYPPESFGPLELQGTKQTQCQFFIQFHNQQCKNLRSVFHFPSIHHEHPSHSPCVYRPAVVWDMTPTNSPFKFWSHQCKPCYQQLRHNTPQYTITRQQKKRTCEQQWQQIGGYILVKNKLDLWNSNKFIPNQKNLHVNSWEYNPASFMSIKHPRQKKPRSKGVLNVLVPKKHFKQIQSWKFQLCDRVDQLPLFPYNRGWETSTQVRRGL